MSEEKEFRLVRTCHSCPEEYDVYYRGQKVAYFRLRHGYFRAEMNDSEVAVYDANPRGDGSFDADERQPFLTAACLAVKAHLEQEKLNETEPIYDITTEEKS